MISLDPEHQKRNDKRSKSSDERIKNGDEQNVIRQEYTEIESKCKSYPFLEKKS